MTSPVLQGPISLGTKVAPGWLSSAAATCVLTWLRWGRARVWRWEVARLEHNIPTWPACGGFRSVCGCFNGYM
eukprot:1149387-Pelagomonas_calceolata.AAC.4